MQVSNESKLQVIFKGDGAIIDMKEYQLAEQNINIEQTLDNDYEQIRKNLHNIAQTFVKITNMPDTLDKMLEEIKENEDDEDLISDLEMDLEDLKEDGKDTFDINSDRTFVVLLSSNEKLINYWKTTEYYAKPIPDSTNDLNELIKSQLHTEEYSKHKDKFKIDIMWLLGFGYMMASYNPIDTKSKYEIFIINTCDIMESWFDIKIPMELRNRDNIKLGNSISEAIEKLEQIPH